jgi:hypothetical protein
MLESVVHGAADVEDLTESWRGLREDERLTEFLRLRPHFSEIFDGDLPRAATLEGSTFTFGVADTTAALDREWKPYASLRLGFRTTALTGELRDPDTGWTGTMSLQTGADTIPPETLTIPVGKLVREAAHLARLYVEALISEHNSPGGPSGIRDHAWRDVGPRLASEDLAVERAVRDLGGLLWERTIGSSPALRDAVERHLNSNERVRLVIEADGPAIADLPWEALFVPPLQVMAGYTLKISVVRQVPETRSLVARAISPPVRILAVNSEPPGTVPLPGARQELELLGRILALPA